MNITAFLEKENTAPALVKVFQSICEASVNISDQLAVAGLGDITGAAGSENIQGEAQQKLDVIADNVFNAALKDSHQVCGIASEEIDDILVFDDETNGEYVIMIDPLDGSSNIDVNVSVGTIFAISKRTSAMGTTAVLADFLQTGEAQVASGYVLYGTSTMLVLTTRNGVHGFTLVPSTGEFMLSHPSLTIAADGKIFSVNEGNLNDFESGIQTFIADKKAINATARYIGSLVADFHRNMLKGGVYMYPSTASSPDGKLRLLYECNPLGLIAEQAGGKASTGRERILDVVPTKLHQRVPYIVGSENMVKTIEDLH